MGHFAKVVDKEGIAKREGKICVSCITYHLFRLLSIMIEALIIPLHFFSIVAVTTNGFIM